MPIHGKTHIETKRLLDAASYKQILALQRVCEEADGIALKLELEYKLADAKNRESSQTDPAINEFMFYIDRQLVGYVGICGFGEASGPLELSGMVHPDYRRNGIFKTLSTLAETECKRRQTKLSLGLCDRKALAGQAILKKQGRTLHHSEYEMHLQSSPDDTTDETLHGISLRKAVNSDAAELARQDSIYFGEEFSAEPEIEKAPHIRLPEEEEKKGVYHLSGSERQCSHRQGKPANKQRKRRYFWFGRVTGRAGKGVRTGSAALSCKEAAGSTGENHLLAGSNG